MIFHTGFCLFASDKTIIASSNLQVYGSGLMVPMQHIQTGQWGNQVDGPRIARISGVQTANGATSTVMYIEKPFVKGWLLIQLQCLLTNDSILCF